MNLGGDTIAVYRAPLVPNRYGAQVRDWANAQMHTADGCQVQPLTATENTVDREYVASHAALFAPYDLDLLATDRVVCNNVTYDVDGEPARWRDDVGAPDHTEAMLKHLAG